MLNNLFRHEGHHQRRIPRIRAWAYISHPVCHLTFLSHPIPLHVSFHPIKSTPAPCSHILQQHCHPLSGCRLVVGGDGCDYEGSQGLHVEPHVLYMDAFTRRGHGIPRHNMEPRPIHPPSNPFLLGLWLWAWSSRLQAPQA